MQQALNDDVTTSAPGHAALGRHGMVATSQPAATAADADASVQGTPPPKK